MRWLVLLSAIVPAADPGVPASIVADGVPPIPRDLIARTEKYRRVPGNTFAGWFAGRREVLVTTGTESTTQVFSVVSPGAPWAQMTFFRERVTGVWPNPVRPQLLIGRDDRGDENDQLAVLDTPTSRIRPLTTPGSRNLRPRWSPGGRFVAWSGNARNGRDMDIYLADLARPEPPRRLIEATGFGSVADWSADGRSIAVLEIDPVAGERCRLVDVDSGRAETIAPRPGATEPADFEELRLAKDGTALYATSRHQGSEFLRLARRDLKSGTTASLTDAIPWDVEQFELADDGRLIAFVTNEDGVSRLHILDPATGKEQPAPALPAGQITRLAFRPGTQEIAFTLETQASPGRLISYLPATRRLVAWTRENPGGLGFDPPRPELIRYKSFDGRMIPAFLYRPGARFADPRPVLIDLHGGPAAQFRPGFLGPTNYLIDGLGIAVVYPNVRGSSGYGRTYLTLDDRLRREDAVRDVGALLDWIATRPDLDASRVAVTGSSYGGFLSLAVAIRYGTKLKAAIDVAGISDFVTFLEGQQEPRRGWARAEFGDERDPAVRAYLRSISPLAGASRIKIPLLVAHGVNDPRVPAAEATRIVDAARATGAQVWSIFARDEGHGFAQRGNMEYVMHAEQYFLMRNLFPARTAGW